MIRHTPLLRILTLCWAMVQLASPGLSALADARLAQASARDARGHVESNSSATCPVVHPPDCAVCRYLTCSASAPPVAPALHGIVRGIMPPVAGMSAGGRLSVILPYLRAPPVI